MTLLHLVFDADAVFWWKRESQKVVGGRFHDGSSPRRYAITSWSVVQMDAVGRPGCHVTVNTIIWHIQTAKMFSPYFIIAQIFI